MFQIYENLESVNLWIEMENGMTLFLPACFGDDHLGSGLVELLP